MLQVNFLPWREQRQKRAIRHFLLLTLCYCAAVLLVLIIRYISIIQQNQYLAEQLALNGAVNSNLLQQISQRKQLQQQTSEQEKALSHIAAMKRLMVNRQILFPYIERALSNSLWLKMIVFRQDKLVIEGQGYGYQPIVDFYQQMEQSPLISHLELDKFSAAQSGLYSFSLSADWREAAR